MGRVAPASLVVVQVRLGSTRFPRKALASLNGHSLTWHVVSRALQIGPPVVVAVPDPRDAAELLCEVPSPARLRYVSGVDENDVLTRFARIVRRYPAQWIMRVTGDCPLLDVSTARNVLTYAQSHAVDYVWNDTATSGYPDGWDVEVFTRAALETAHTFATNAGDREHVTPWMRRHLRCAMLAPSWRWAGPKLSVDTPEDLEAIRALDTRSDSWWRAYVQQGQ